MKLQAGGPFYPLESGRRDSTMSFSEVATYDLPTPYDNLPKTMASFALRGFNERETVSLLGTSISFLTFFLFLHCFLPEMSLVLVCSLHFDFIFRRGCYLSVGLSLHSSYGITIPVLSNFFGIQLS